MEVIKFSCDVDGIINDYPLCWLRYLADKTGVLYETVSLAKRYEKEYRRIKEEYRKSTYKANLPVMRKNRDVLCQIISNGLVPVMVTSRPIFDSKYPDLYNSTLKWLQNSGIVFSQFDFKDPDANFLERNKQISFHIDDDPLYALKVAEKRVKVYLLKNDNWDFSCLFGNTNSDRIVVVNNLEDILRYESIL